MQNRKKSLITWGFLSCFPVVILSSCLKTIEPAAVEAKSYISIMHLAAKAPSVEVYVNSQKASQEIFPGTFSSAYSGVTPGQFDIGFRKAGSDSVVASIAAAAYDSAKYYTLLLYNDQPTSAKALRIVDDFSVLDGTSAHYRFFHMASDVEPVDLYLNNVKVQSGRQYADNIVIGNYNNFVSYSPGSYIIEVKKAGTDSVISSTSANLFQSNAFTIFLNGLANSAGVNTLDLDVLQASN